MSDQPINYEAVLADLEARKAQLEVTIAGIRLHLRSVRYRPERRAKRRRWLCRACSAHDAFIGMSIPEAAKKHLTAVRKKLSTQEIMTALEAGGLPPSKYSTVYAILSRRENKVGDIINMKGDWALQEWYPGITGRRHLVAKRGMMPTTRPKMPTKRKPLLLSSFFVPPSPSGLACDFAKPLRAQFRFWAGPPLRPPNLPKATAA